MDNKLSFAKQCQYIKDKAVKANGLLRYYNGITKGMEVNTALMLYKSLVRFTIDYGSFIFYPQDENNSIKVERAQFLGLRTALGFRNSTPNNVLLGEAKVMSIKDRTEYLARNFMAKTMAYREENLKDNIERLNKMELLHRLRYPRKRPMIVTEAWNRVKKDKSKIRSKRKYGIFLMDYWTVTKELNIDLYTGKGYIIGLTEVQLLEEVKKTFKIKGRIMTIYTNGYYSRSEDSISTGCAFVIPEMEMSYMISLNKDCSSYTAEASAIAKVLQFVKNQEWKNDIIIYTDSLSLLLKSVKNNKINAYANPYILEIRQRYFELQEIKGREGKKKFFVGYQIIKEY